jgi:hypothetical protein
MRLVLLIIIAGIIVLIGCNVASFLDAQVGILCLPLSFGIAVLVLVGGIERSVSRNYYTKQNRTFYRGSFDSLLSSRMYEKDTIGDALISRTSAAIGTGLVFLIAHTLLSVDTITTSYDTQLATQHSLAPIINFGIDILIISTIMLFSFGIKKIKTISK